MMNRLSLVLVTVILGACAGTGTGNPFTQDVRVGAHSSDPQTYSLITAAGGGVVAEAWMVGGAIRFVACSDGDDSEFDPLGAQDRAQAPLLVSATLDETPYCTVSVALGGDVTIPSNAPAELSEGTPVVVVGQTAQGTTFRIVSSSASINLETSPIGDPPVGEGFTLSEESPPLFLGFDIATWLQGIEIDSAVQTAGVVVIDSANNTGLLSRFESQLSLGAGLFLDENGNADVDPGDRAIAMGI